MHKNSDGTGRGNRRSAPQPDDAERRSPMLSDSLRILTLEVEPVAALADRALDRDRPARIDGVRGARDDAFRDPLVWRKTRRTARDRPRHRFTNVPAVEHPLTSLPLQLHYVQHVFVMPARRALEVRRLTLQRDPRRRDGQVGAEGVQFRENAREPDSGRGDRLNIDIRQIVVARPLRGLSTTPGRRQATRRRSRAASDRSARRARSRHDANLRLVQPGAFTGGALAGLREPLLAEGEPTRPASRGFDDDLMSRRPCRPDRVTQVFFEVSALQPELPCERRDRSRRGRQDVQQLFADSHPGTGFNLSVSRLQLIDVPRHPRVGVAM